jgi:hypothetical protein
MTLTTGDGRFRSGDALHAAQARDIVIANTVK